VADRVVESAADSFRAIWEGRLRIPGWAQGEPEMSDERIERGADVEAERGAAHRR